MSVIEVMIDLRERGIQLEAHGDRLRYSPRSSVTPELAQRMKAHKVALLAILTADDIPAAVLWHAALDQLEASEAFPPEHLAVCRRASVTWESERPAGDCVNEPGERNDRSTTSDTPRHNYALDGQPEPQNRAGQNNQY